MLYARCAAGENHRVSHVDTPPRARGVSFRYATSFLAMNVWDAPGSGTILISQPS